MSHTARKHNVAAPCGTTLLPRDLTAAQLEAAHVLASAESLVIDELTDQEYDNLLAALRSRTLVADCRRGHRMSRQRSSGLASLARVHGSEQYDPV